MPRGAYLFPGLVVWWPPGFPLRGELEEWLRRGSLRVVYLFSLRVFCLGISRTGGFEDQRHYPEVCRLVGPGPPFRWGALGLGVLGSWGGGWPRPPGPVFRLAPPLCSPLPNPPKAHRIPPTINLDTDWQTFVSSSVWGRSGRPVVAPCGGRTFGM